MTDFRASALWRKAMTSESTCMPLKLQLARVRTQASRQAACPICHEATILPKDVLGICLPSGHVVETHLKGQYGTEFPAWPCPGVHVLAELREALRLPSYRAGDAPDEVL